MAIDKATLRAAALIFRERAEAVRNSLSMRGISREDLVNARQRVAELEKRLDDNAQEAAALELKAAEIEAEIGT